MGQGPIHRSLLRRSRTWVKGATERACARQRVFDAIGESMFYCFLGVGVVNYSQTLRLDNLGNLIEQDKLCSLTQENIVVKKFVYDDEVELTPQPVLSVVRNTRSRSKKNKA